MLRIALSTLAARKSGSLGALGAVGFSVVLVVSCGILLESSLRMPVAVERLHGAAVVVQGKPTIESGHGEGDVPVFLSERRRLDGGLASRIRGLPGVANVVADRSVYAQLLDRRGRVLGSESATSVGHGWASAALTPYSLASGHAPQGAADVVLDARLATRASLRPGDRVRVLTTGGTRGFTVAGTAAPRGVHVHEPSLFFRDDVAAKLAGTGTLVDLLGIVTAPGADPKSVADSVRDALDRPELRVLTGEKRGDAESPDGALSREDIVAGLMVFGVLSAFIAIFVVGSTFALSVRQRHRELALFRAIGATPRQVRRMVAGEAFLAALAAFAVAAPLAVLVTHLERGLFVRANVVPEDLHVAVGFVPFLVGLAVAIVTTQIAAFASARRASRIRPTEALREAQPRAFSWLRTVAGLGMLVAGVATLFMLARGASGGTDAPAATMVFMLAAALLGPLLALPFAWLLGLPLAALSRGPGMLARANTRANLRRAASVATPVMLAVSLICTITFAKSALKEQTGKQTAERVTAGYVLRADDASGLPAAVAAAARRAPGVVGATGSIGTTVEVAPDGSNLVAVPARGVDAGTLAGLIDLGVESGSLHELAGDALAVSTSSARAYGWHRGDRVQLWLGDGTPARLRVVATFKRPLGFGEIVLPRALVERHVSERLDDAIFVRAADPAGLRALVQAYPTVQVLTRDGYRAELEAAADTEALAIYVLLAVIGIFCAIALVNATAMATGERAREFALLRLVGASKKQVRAMARRETLIMVAFGLVMGSLVAIPGLAAFSYGLTGSFVPSFSAKAYGALLGIYTVLAFAAAELPTRCALRMNPVKAMAARE